MTHDYENYWTIGRRARRLARVPIVAAITLAIGLLCGGWFGDGEFGVSISCVIGAVVGTLVAYAVDVDDEPDHLRIERYRRERARDARGGGRW
jgi:hypothetical protein